jgi:hypothetical protein
MFTPAAIAMDANVWRHLRCGRPEHQVRPNEATLGKPVRPKQTLPLRPGGA